MLILTYSTEADPTVRHTFGQLGSQLSSLVEYADRQY